jgi:hypothetical protein
MKKAPVISHKLVLSDQKESSAAQDLLVAVSGLCSGSTISNALKKVFFVA